MSTTTSTCTTFACVTFQLLLPRVGLDVGCLQKAALEGSHFKAPPPPREKKGDLLGFVGKHAIQKPMKRFMLKPPTRRYDLSRPSPVTRAAALSIGYRYKTNTIEVKIFLYVARFALERQSERDIAGKTIRSREGIKPRLSFLSPWPPAPTPRPGDAPLALRLFKVSDPCPDEI